MESSAIGLSLTIEFFDDTLWFSKITRRIFLMDKKNFLMDKKNFNGQEESSFFFFNFNLRRRSNSG